MYFWKGQTGSSSGRRHVFDWSNLCQSCQCWGTSGSERCSNKLSNYTFLIIGKEHTDVSVLKKIKNIIFLGHIDHNQIPFYVKNFDLAIIPYYKTEFTENVYSFKLNEYLAMGVPVITTDLNEFKIFEKKYPNTVYVSNSYEQFKRYLEKNLSFYEKHKDYRIRIAKENSWSNRFLQIEKIFNQLYNKNISIFRKKILKEQYNFINSKSIISYILIPILFMYIISFYSPLFSSLSKGLEVDYVINKADAIVVFSGDGYAGYENLGFQQRTLDVLKYYRLGYADKVFVSSGKEQKISQVEIIKALLIQNNVLEKDIKIFTQYPSSTYENVIMVEKELTKNKIDEIIFITAPFHSKRSYLLWKKKCTSNKDLFCRTN